MTEQAPAQASMTQTGRTCPVCKGEGMITGWPVNAVGEPDTYATGMTSIQCPNCNVGYGLGQVPAEPDVNAELLVALKKITQIYGDECPAHKGKVCHWARARLAIQRAEAQR